MHSLADIHRTQDAAVTMLLKVPAFVLPMVFACSLGVLALAWQEREVDARGKAPIEDYFGLDDQSRVSEPTAKCAWPTACWPHALTSLHSRW